LCVFLHHSVPGFSLSDKLAPASHF
jgi:hypothetical protein